MNRLYVKAAVLLGVVFISFSAILVRFSNSESLVIAFYRMLFASLLMFLVSAAGRQDLRKAAMLTSGEKSMILTGGVFLAFHFHAFIESLNHTTVASSTVLVTTHPIFVAGISAFFLGEKISGGSLGAVCLSLLGAVMLACSDFTGGTNLYGDLLAFGGALLMAGYILVGRQARKTMSASLYNFYVYLVCTLVLLLLNVIGGTDLAVTAGREILIFFGLAFFCTLLGHSVLNWALKYVSSAFVSASIIGEPVFSTVFAFLIFRETPSLLQAAGGCVALIGIFLLMKFEE